MAHRRSSLETEIKLRAGSAVEARGLLRRREFSVRKRRVFESNTIFDTRDGALRRRRNVLRLREAGSVHVITFKGAPLPGPHKSREELETPIGDARVASAILNRAGYEAVFRYEKYRTVYGREGSSGMIMLDETPIGVFLELEGTPRWIDRTARELGYTESDYITLSYGRLYLDHCQSHRAAPKDMVFQRS